MFDIGFLEILMIFLVVLFILGPEEVPKIFLTLGRYIKRIKMMVHNLQVTMNEELKKIETPNDHSSTKKSTKIKKKDKVTDE